MKKSGEYWNTITAEAKWLEIIREIISCHFAISKKVNKILNNIYAD